MKRILSLLLVLSMLLGTMLLIGCSEPNNGGTTTTPNPSTPGGETPGESEWADNLDTEAIKNDLGGQELIISCFETYDYEIYAEESSKDALDQLIFKRNKKIEERFGIKITPDVTKATGSSDMASHIAYVQQEIASMAPSFHLIAMMAWQSGKLITGGNYRDWRSGVPYAKDSLAAGDAWWPTEMNKNSTVNGRQFVAISDMSITLVDLSFVTMFNESLATENHIAENYGNTIGKTYTTMYDIVKDGQWTVDALIAITKDAWVDSENGIRDKVDPEDLIGYQNMGGTELDNFVYSCGFSYIQNDGVSNPQVWTMPQTFDALVNKMRAYFTDNKGICKGGAEMEINYENRSESFAGNHILFYSANVGELNRTYIKGMEKNFGVLPYPKLNAAQAEYLTGADDNITVLSISKYTTGKNVRLAGAITVALSAETNKSINETYYEMLVKHDSGFSNRAALEMLDLVMKGRVYDLSIYHYDDLQFSSEGSASLGTYFRYLMSTATNQSATGSWSSAGPVCENMMKSLISKYAAIK